VPKEILEAAEVDGAGLITVLLRVVGPIALRGPAATSLICPVLIAGFAAQDKLVRGLSLGAVK
jgi:ABC-type glycerol-3-phosphate transport system permease component